MTIYYDYVALPHQSYEQFRSAIMDNGFDVDGVAGCQCVDVAKLINWNLGYPSPYWDTGATGYAYGGWTVISARQFNARDCSLVASLNNVKRGDLIVLDSSSLNVAGHVTFADEDYDGSGYLWCVGQNQGGSPLPMGGTVVTRNRLGMEKFLGGFRYNTWNGNDKKHKFPFVLYANKIRNR